MTPAGILVVLVAFGLGATASWLWAARRAREPGRPFVPPALASEAGREDLAALRREADAARAELDEIHSSVSHDLRSPIGAALNFLTVLEEDHGERFDADGRAILARVRRSADSALTLLDGLARLAHVGRRALELRLVDVDALVRSAFAAALPSGRSVELTVVDPLPPVMADPELLRIAFKELFSNALQFTAGREKARITVGARRHDGTIEYWVADDGIGFDPRFAGKLFRIFERLHPRDEFPGAGAGLAVVRRVAERHGGRVRAEAEAQRGATILLSLPAPAREGGP
jgi:light-regulated signal transduction histidine kinase (bacteriophytochrome)